MTFCETRDGALIPVARIASIEPAREQNPWRLLRTLDGAEYEIGADQCDEVGQMIPAQPGFAAVMKRHSRFGGGRMVIEPVRPAFSGNGQTWF
jgi:hypothetical protein